jgi:hypothetical protein
MSLCDALLLDPYAIDLSRAEVWIAVRTDGVAGSGTENDPYDGSTQVKFDNLMGMTFQGLTNMLIHLGPGTFQTLGFPTAGGWWPYSGWKITGSGMEVTVLKLVGVPANTRKSAIGSLYPVNNFLTSFEVSDLTIDCNLAGQVANVTCEAVAVTGAHNRLRRIRVINFGTTYGGYECFALSPTSANGDIATKGEVVDNWMDACILEQPGVSNSTTLTFMNHDAGESGSFQMAYHRACVIRNCFVNAEYRTNPVPIASIVISGGTATVATRLPHGYANGQYVRISGAVIGGTTNNSYNGSYPISSATPFGFQYTPNPTQSVNPTGDMWLGRFSSQVVETTNFQQISGNTVQVTTATPHFRLVGDYVLIVFANNAALNGYFPVTAVVGYKDFQVLVNQTPPATGAGGFITALFQCCSADGGTAAVVETNRFINTAVAGPYHDTWSSKDITIRNNYHRGVVTGPYQNLGSIDSLRNDISLSNNGLDSVAILTSQSNHYVVSGETIWVQGARFAPYNGFFVVTRLSPTQLQYEMASIPGGSSPYPSASYGRLWQLGRIIIENNWIELALNILSSGYGPPIAIDFYNSNANVVPPTFLTLQAVIRRNQIQSLDGVVDGSGFPTGIWPNNCANGIVEENVIDLNSVNNGPAVRQAYSGSVSYFNNETSSGNLIQGNNWNTGLYLDELSTNLDLALVASF